MTLPSKQRAYTVFLSFCLFLFAWPGKQAAAQELSASEQKQASLAVTRTVLGILGFVRWPERRGTLTLCVTGDTQFAGALSGDLRQNNGEPLHVQRYVQPAVQKLPPDVPLDCNVLYLGRLSLAVQNRLFERFLRRPTLLISEADAECAVGNMFCLVIVGRQVGFHINLDALARSGLRIHPNVLKLARGKP